MTSTIDIDGATIVYDDVSPERASGNGPVVLLHGGLSASESWEAQLPALAARHRVLLPDRRGHGRSPDTPAPFTYEAMAAETIGFLELVVGGHSTLVGWSDGGIIALVVAIQRPDLVRRLVTIGAAYDIDGNEPSFNASVPAMAADPPSLRRPRDTYAAVAPGGDAGWPAFLAKTVDLWQSGPHIPRHEIATIEAPVLVISGDDDIVQLEHTLVLYRALPNGQLAVIPGASHLVPVEKPALLDHLLASFVEQDTPHELMPTHRARPDGRDGARVR
jgi:pimeloyl-ACP methyl ester carboxylesterase